MKSCKSALLTESITVLQRAEVEQETGRINSDKTKCQGILSFTFSDGAQIAQLVKTASCRPDHHMNESLIPGRRKTFLFFPQGIPDLLWGPPSMLLNGCQHLFPLE
jgi:hypothetical protein